MMNFMDRGIPEGEDRTTLTRVMRGGTAGVIEP
jgi:hypothetical protein